MFNIKGKGLGRCKGRVAGRQLLDQLKVWDKRASTPTIDLRPISMYCLTWEWATGIHARNKCWVLKGASIHLRFSLPVATEHR